MLQLDQTKTFSQKQIQSWSLTQKTKTCSTILSVVSSSLTNIAKLVNGTDTCHCFAIIPGYKQGYIKLYATIPGNYQGTIE